MPPCLLPPSSASCWPSLLALPLGSTTRAHHFFGLAEFRDPFSRRCDHFSHHHLFRALCATDRFYFTAHSSGYSLYVHGARSLTLRTRHPSPDHSLHPYPHTDHLCPIFHPSRCPFALRIYQPSSSRSSWLELAAALLARQSHGWRDGESAQRPRWPIPRLNGACSGLVRRVVA